MDLLQLDTLATTHVTKTINPIKKNTWHGLHNVKRKGSAVGEQINSINLKESLIFIYIQKINFILSFFSEIYQTLQTYHFGYFGHASLWPVQTILSAFRNLFIFMQK